MPCLSVRQPQLPSNKQVVRLIAFLHPFVRLGFVAMAKQVDIGGDGWTELRQFLWFFLWIVSALFLFLHNLMEFPHPGQDDNREGVVMEDGHVGPSNLAQPALAVVAPPNAQVTPLGAADEVLESPYKCNMGWPGNGVFMLLHRGCILAYSTHWRRQLGWCQPSLSTKTKSSSCGRKPKHG